MVAAKNLHGFQVPAIAAIAVDKLNLAKDDLWALSAYLSSQHEYSFWSVFLWTLPLLGSSQMMCDNFQMGVPQASAIVVGDGRRVVSLNPLVTEWLFEHRLIPSGSCLFVNVSATEPKRSKSYLRRPRPFPSLAEALLLAGPPSTALAMAFVYMVTSLGAYSAAFLGTLYIVTFASNYGVGRQCQVAWTGYLGDLEIARMLVIAPGDRWAVIRGPRNLVKLMTTGRHNGQSVTKWTYLGQCFLVATLVSVFLLQDGSLRDGFCISGAVCALHFLAWYRCKHFAGTPVIRTVRVEVTGIKEYGQTSDLVEALSSTVKSDSWAYESGLLARAYGQGWKSVSDVI